MLTKEDAETEAPREPVKGLQGSLLLVLAEPAGPAAAPEPAQPAPRRRSPDAIDALAREVLGSASTGRSLYDVWLEDIKG